MSKLFSGRSKSKTDYLTTESSDFEKLRKKYQAQEIGSIKARSKTRAVGEIVTTRTIPRANGYWHEVIIKDETGKLVGWFFGRKDISGIIMGSHVMFEGTATFDEGELTIANPYYEFVD